MKDIRRIIKEALKDEKFDSINNKTKEEIVEKLYIYHEELLYQNEELQRVNDELNKAKLRFKNLFDKAPISYIYLTENLEIVDFNLKAAEYLKSKNSIGKKLSDFIDENSQDAYYLHFRKQIKTKDSVESYIKIKIKEKIKHYKLISRPFEIDHEKIFLCALIDQTSEIKKTKKIKDLTYQDPLTKLYNRRLFNEELKRLDVKRNYPLGIILADINGLKLINDSFGHLVGDEFLIKTAGVFKKILRGDEITARLGGDEFAVLLPGVKRKEIEKIVNRIQKGIKKLEINDISFSVACGYALKEKAEEDIYDVFRKAENLMYQNKILMESNYHKNAIDAIITTLHEKYPKEKEHSFRVSAYMKLFLKSESIDIESNALMETVGILHDIGKIAINHTILRKNDNLTDAQYKIIKKHPEIGYRILKSAGVSQEILEAVLYHHEAYDGSGYPKGLKGDEIPLLARMLTVCDAFDAMYSERPYSKEWDKSSVLEELKRCSGIQFDPEITDLFIKLINENECDFGHIEGSWTEFIMSK